MKSRSRLALYFSRAYMRDNLFSVSSYTTKRRRLVIEPSSYLKSLQHVEKLFLPDSCFQTFAPQASRLARHVVSVTLCYDHRAC